MKYETVSPRQVRVEDSPYVVSQGPPPAELVESVRRLGVLAPPLVSPGPDGVWWCVTGARRLRAALEIELDPLTVGVFPPATPPALLFRAAIDDNRLQRPLNLLECARLSRSIQAKLQLPAAAVMDEYFPLLGLHPSPELWNTLAALPDMPPRVGQMVAAERLPLKTLTLLRAFPLSEQALLAEVMDAYHLGTNRQLQLLTFCRDGRRRFGESARPLLDAAGVWPLPGFGEQNVPQRIESVFASLHRRFWPTLSRREDQLRRVRQRLVAAGRIRLQAWPAFEKREYRLEVTFRDGSELAETLIRLQSAEWRTVMAELFVPLADEE
ncbi:MAG: ParB N-terminal domain-containing protein [Acidobacteria bacterium]|nr:ParB N-terminal domain-containing protein [Acidobacteriota bacterium]